MNEIYVERYGYCKGISKEKYLKGNFKYKFTIEEDGEFYDIIEDRKTDEWFYTQI